MLLLITFIGILAGMLISWHGTLWEFIGAVLLAVWSAWVNCLFWGVGAGSLPTRVVCRIVPCSDPGKGKKLEQKVEQWVKTWNIVRLNVPTFLQKIEHIKKLEHL